MAKGNAEDKSNQEILAERLKNQANAEVEAPDELFPSPPIDMPAEIMQAMQRSNDTSTAVAIPDDGKDYTRDLDEADVVFPRVRLTQGQSRAAQDEDNPVPVGNWHLSTGNTNLGKVIKFVPIDMHKTRALWVNNVGRMCASRDFKTGVGMPGGNCFACPLKDWSEEEGKRKPPKCSVNYNYMALILPEPDVVKTLGEEQDLEAFTALTLFTRSAATLAREFNTKKQQNKSRPWYYWTYTLSRKPGKGPGGQQFFYPVITGVEKTSKDNIALCEDFIGAFDEEELTARMDRTIDAEDATTSDDDDE